MPIYEYECRKCSYKFEIRRSFGEDGRAHCPNCLGEARRVFCPVPIFFKGPGFYVTDNASTNKRQSDSRRDEDRHADLSKGAENPKDEKGGVAS